MPKLSRTYIPDDVAKADMGVAFGRGAQTYGPKTLSVPALAAGDRFLTRRLANKKAPYASVRKKALEVAFDVGASAAKNAGAAKVIGESHLQPVLDDLRKKRMLGGDCPF